MQSAEYDKNDEVARWLRGVSFSAKLLRLKTGTILQRDLIFDVGLYDGADTEFYLAKGFRVLAIEANPAHVDAARVKFATSISDGRLTILNSAVARKSGGKVHLNIPSGHDEWASTTRQKWADLSVRTVDVETVTWAELVSRFGSPYYLKADIEGAEMALIESMYSTKDLPPYVSFEASDPAIPAHLSVLGYRYFKLVDQTGHNAVSLPVNPREGRYVEQRFTDSHSGPFGRESPGAWQNAKSIIQEAIELLANADRVPVWHDFHAKLRLF